MTHFGFQVGGQFPEGMPPGPELAATARAAEDRGFDSVWAGEHLSFHHPIHEVFVALSYLAGATSRVGLGAGIVLAPLRQPVWMAKAAASLDHISGGRLILGVGVGGEGEKDFEAAGVSPRSRGARTDEHLEIARLLWTTDDAGFAGRFASFEGVTIEPKPAQPGGPPVWIGGKSEAAALRAARHGDGWLPAYVSPRQFAAGVSTIRSEAARVGRPEPGYGVCLHTLVGEDDAAVREAARAHFSERYQQETPDHVLDKLCLVGGPGRVRERVAEYVASGAGHVVVIPMAGRSRHREQIELLGSQVLGR